MAGELRAEPDRQPEFPDQPWLDDVVARALDEDLGGRPGRDVTTMATVPPAAAGEALLVARVDGVLAALAAVPTCLRQVESRFDLAATEIEWHVSDSGRVGAGDLVARLSGPVWALLIAERTLLNLVCRASGIATHTRAWADALAGTGCRVLDTRKTTPTLRTLEKYAVHCGGGVNKRFGLHDVAMVKDNHKLAAGSVTAAYQAVRDRYPGVAVQVEVTTPAEASEAVRAGARFLLCDNMSPAVLAQAVKQARTSAAAPVELEATGGLTLARAGEYAATGVDYLSVGGLTHSSPALDLALELSASS